MTNKTQHDATTLQKWPLEVLLVTLLSSDKLFFNWDPRIGFVSSLLGLLLLFFNSVLGLSRLIASKHWDLLHFLHLCFLLDFQLDCTRIIIKQGILLVGCSFSGWVEVVDEGCDQLGQGLCPNLGRRKPMVTGQNRVTSDKCSSGPKKLEAVTLTVTLCDVIR